MSEIFLNGHDGVKLQCNYSINNDVVFSNNLSILILHPHPQFGGTMNNKVIFNCYKTFKNIGFSVLRYNSRGVEKSEGVFTDGDREAEDAIVLSDWLSQQKLNNADSTTKNRKIYILGFSFGAYVLSKILPRIAFLVEKFIMIAPPSNLFHFCDFSEIQTQGIVIQGTNDDIVPVDFTDNLLKNSPKNIFYSKIEGASHFFEGYEKDLSNLLVEFISK